MVAFKPAPKVQMSVNTIAGRKVVSITSEYGTAAISAEGLSADVEWPNLADVARKLAVHGVAKLRRTR